MTNMLGNIDAPIGKLRIPGSWCANSLAQWHIHRSEGQLVHRKGHREGARAGEWVSSVLRTHGLLGFAPLRRFRRFAFAFSFSSRDCLTDDWILSFRDLY